MNLNGVHKFLLGFSWFVMTSWVIFQAIGIAGLIVIGKFIYVLALIVLIVAIVAGLVWFFRDILRVDVS